jgi:hypothetical protein
MAKTFYCPGCGREMGSCGHIAGSPITAPSTIHPRCTICNVQYTFTCNGDCT